MAPCRRVLDILRKHGLLDKVQVLVVQSDGRPDRNHTFWTVVLAYLAIALSLPNLQQLVVKRGAAGQSYVNPVERVMSVLNLALQGYAGCRDDATPETEAVLRTATACQLSAKCSLQRMPHSHVMRRVRTYSVTRGP